MHVLVQNRFTQVAVLLAVFGCGLVIGGLRSPMAAWAQDERSSRPQARLTLVSMQRIASDGVPINNCTDITIMPVRPAIGRAAPIDAVLVLCEW